MCPLKILKNITLLPMLPKEMRVTLTNNPQLFYALLNNFGILNFEFEIFAVTNNLLTFKYNPVALKVCQILFYYIFKATFFE